VFICSLYCVVKFQSVSVLVLPVGFTLHSEYNVLEGSVLDFIRLDDLLAVDVAAGLGLQLVDDRVLVAPNVDLQKKTKISVTVDI
jgi:hypothetical protein